MSNFHNGVSKSGAWLLEASRHVALDIQPNAIAPGGRQNVPVQRQQPAVPVSSTPDEPWVKADWRNGNGGAFHSDVRPPTSSDVPHPHDVLGPNDKRWAAVNASEDPEHDPWNVLGGFGQNFEGLVQNQLSHHANMDPQQAHEGRVWYRAAHEGTKDLSDKTIGDHAKTVAIHSAFSPKTAWDTNLEKGHHFMTHYDGDPNFQMPGMEAHTEKAKAIWHDPNGAEKEILSGPKTKAFSNNILDPSPLREPRPGEHDDAGYYQLPENPHTGEADWRLHPDQNTTVDTHHVRLTNTPHGADLSDQKYETPPYFGKGISVGGQKFNPSYDLHSRANWEATRRINAAQADPQRHMIPKQSQAGPWGKFKSDIVNAGAAPDMPAVGQPPKTWTPNKKNWDQNKWVKQHPLTSPVVTPQYQQDHDADWWDDPRRPKQDLRQTPNWHRRRPAHVAALADDGSVWGEMLGDYVRRNPQHPVENVLEQHEDERLGPHPHEASQWYVAAIEKSWYTTAPIGGKPRRPNAPRYGPSRPKKASWYVTADMDVDGKDPDAMPAEQQVSSGGQVGTPLGYASDSATDPHAPSYDSMFPAPHVTPAPIGGGGHGGAGGAPVSEGGGGGSAVGGNPAGGPPSQSLSEALTRAGIDPSMHPLISGFSKAEGNNPSGAPTLGFTDSQAGSTLDQHAQALAKQLQDRQSVSGPFPSDGSPHDQASWMATVVGQSGSPSDWQGHAQPARSDYVNRVVNGMPSPTPAPTAPKAGL